MSTAATPITDACALKAVELIARHLRTAVNHGATTSNAREQMAVRSSLAGMAFNNASLGYVHTMAHQLGGFTTCPGVYNALLLPHVEAFNVPTSAARLRDVAHAMGVDVAGLDAEAGAGLPGRHPPIGTGWGIPKCLADLGVKEGGHSAAGHQRSRTPGGLTNPRTATQADIEGIFRAGHDGLTPGHVDSAPPHRHPATPTVVATPAALELLALLQTNQWART